MLHWHQLSSLWTFLCFFYIFCHRKNSQSASVARFLFNINRVCTSSFLHLLEAKVCLIFCQLLTLNSWIVTFQLLLSIATWEWNSKLEYAGAIESRVWSDKNCLKWYKMKNFAWPEWSDTSKSGKKFELWREMCIWTFFHYLKFSKKILSGYWNSNARNFAIIIKPIVQK